MDQTRYRRPSSPTGAGRRMNAPLRSSTGTLYPAYEPYYPPSRIARDAPPSPRQGGERLLYPERPFPRGYADDLPTSPGLRGGYGRPRRATLDPQDDSGRRPVVQPAGPPPLLRPIVHPGVAEGPSSPMSKRYPSSSGDYYITPASSHHRHQRGQYSMDSPEAGRYTRQIDGPSEVRDRPMERGSYRSSGVGGGRRGYHLSGPLVRHPDVDDGRYGYDAYGGYGYGDTDYHVDPYRDTAPRRPRGDSLEALRRERPVSMAAVEGYVPRSPSTRERGPPPTTRGLARASVSSKTGPPERHARGSVDDMVYDYPSPRTEDVVRTPSTRSSRHKPPVLHHEREDPRPLYREGVDEPREKGRSRYDRPYDDDVRPKDDGRPRDDVRTRGYGILSEVQADDSGSASDSDGRTRRHRRRPPPDTEPPKLRPVNGDVRTAEREIREQVLPIREGREKPRRDRDRDARDKDDRDRDALEPDHIEPPKREARDRDTLERDPREREGPSRRTREKEGLDKEAHGRESIPVDLRGREPQEREKLKDDGDRGVDRPDHIRVVSPPRENKAPVKGILREPREKFPEDPAPIREGVAPLKDALKDGKKGIPPGARWTKVDRKLVNPAALDEAKERYEERLDHVIVLRVLTRDEIETLAARTQEIRDERYDRDKLDRDRRDRHRRKNEERGDGYTRERHEHDTSDAQSSAPTESTRSEPIAIPTKADSGVFHDGEASDVHPGYPSSPQSYKDAQSYKDPQFYMSGGR